MRHGESEANAKGVMAGSAVDSPLTERGKEQALVVASKIKGVKFDYVFSSPLSRARETARIISAECNIAVKVVEDARLKEFNVGDAAGMNAEEYHRLRKQGHIFNGSESMDDVHERISSFLADLNVHAHNILVVSHNGTGKMMQTVLNSKSSEEIKNLPNQANDEVLVISTKISDC